MGEILWGKYDPDVDVISAFDVILFNVAFRKRLSTCFEMNTLKKSLKHKRRASSTVAQTTLLFERKKIRHGNFRD